MAELSDEDLLAELGVEIQPEKKHTRSPREERIIAGFEDIQRFVAEHGRPPQHGEDRDIFERLYAVRLDRLRAQPDCRELLATMDKDGLLENESTSTVDVAGLDDDRLLAELGIEPADADDDITQLRHVAPAAERKASEEIANQQRCADFDVFRPMFETVEADLASGARVTRPFGKDAAIEKGDMFILRGQLAYVASVGEQVKAPNGQIDARLRVIYSNGTESNLLAWSLQRALYKDEGARRVSEPTAGPLFGDAVENDDMASGTIYVLQSRSDHPFIAEHRELIHKIGVTRGNVEGRVANAAKDPTFLFADVDIVRRYQLFNISRSKLEAMLHRVFAEARLELALRDRFDQPVQPREWFLVPLHVIDQVIDRIRRGSIVDVQYDRSTASLVADDPSSA